MATIFRADQFFSEAHVSTSCEAGEIGKLGFEFGFKATAVSLYNDKASDVYVSLDSTTGSTGGFRLKAGENVAFTLPIGGCSVASTATSTGDKVRVLAVRA